MSLQRVNKDRVRVDFIEPLPKVPTEEDKLPEGMSEEDLKAKYAKLVWCEYYACKHNQQIGAERTLKTILKNKAYTPFADDPGIRFLPAFYLILDIVTT